MQVNDLKTWFDQLQLDEYRQKIASRILNRNSPAPANPAGCWAWLSYIKPFGQFTQWGESQRIQLTRNLGSNLTNSLYILDEPSIGLHARDTERLITF
jgi:excinuclease ABC subunit A